MSDYYMPEQDGFTFCRRVKEHPKLRRSFFILLTSASTIEQRVRGFDVGADDYITKPFHEEELYARFDKIVHEFLERNKPMHQLLGHAVPIQSAEMALECQLVSNGLYCGEPLFVPAHRNSYSSVNTGEPGWLMTEVYNGMTGRSFLAVFESQDIRKGPISRVHLRHHLPYSMHGFWQHIDNVIV